MSTMIVLKVLHLGCLGRVPLLGSITPPGLHCILFASGENADAYQCLPPCLLLLGIIVTSPHPSRL